MTHQHFSKVQQAPPDPILGITESFNKDSNPHKINLCVGVYQSETGGNPVLKSIKQAERMLLEQETTKDYLGIDGDREYTRGVQELLFGKSAETLGSNRAATLQTPGGTGALRVGADFIRSQYPQARVWVSDPTWPNHKGIFNSAGLEVKTYPYFDAENSRIRLDELLAALEAVPEGDVVLLHGCCHNPTGIDPTDEEWARIVEIFRARRIIPFLDFAYQGLGRGLDEDASSIRAFDKAGLEMLIASSFSKNMGLYRERVGAITFVTADSEAAGRVMSQAKLLVRTNYSNPPSHGAKTAGIVMGNPQIRELWISELNQMRDRIRQMRQDFVKKLAEVGVKQNFEFLAGQNGMFSFSGISGAQVERLKNEFGIYMAQNGRINVAAITPGNIDYLCRSILQTLHG